jgi:hypothetical protein
MSSPWPGRDAEGAGVFARPTPRKARDRSASKLSTQYRRAAGQSSLSRRKVAAAAAVAAACPPPVLPSRASLGGTRGGGGTPACVAGRTPQSNAATPLFSPDTDAILGVLIQNEQATKGAAGGAAVDAPPRSTATNVGGRATPAEGFRMPTSAHSHKISKAATPAEPGSQPAALEAIDAVTAFTVTSPTSKHWRDFSSEERAAAECIGYDQQSWDTGGEAPFQRAWGGLSAPQQEAAALLGFQPARFQAPRPRPSGNSAGPGWTNHPGWVLKRGSGLVNWYYIAPDGRRFTDEQEALSYEQKSPMVQCGGGGGGGQPAGDAEGDAEGNAEDDAEAAPSAKTRKHAQAGRRSNEDAAPAAPAGGAEPTITQPPRAAGAVSLKRLHDQSPWLQFASDCQRC